MRLTRTGVAPAVVLVLLAGLTGCTRHGGLDGSGPAGAPVPTISRPAAAATSGSSGAGAEPASVPPSAASASALDGIDQDLAEVDGALSQSSADTSAGDAAAKQSDSP